MQQYSYKNTPIHYTPQFFKFITAGYWPAAVEGMWIALLQQISLNKITEPQLQEVAQFYDLATDLDPYFYELYEQAGIYFGFYKEDGAQASRFLEKGAAAYETLVKNHSNKKFVSRFWSHPYSLYIYLAYAYGFVAYDWPKAKATFLRAAEIPGAPLYILEMKKWLVQEGSEKLLAKKALNHLILYANDAHQKQKYFQKLKELEATP